MDDVDDDDDDDWGDDEDWGDDNGWGAMMMMVLFATFLYHSEPVPLPPLRLLGHGGD